MEDYRKAHVPAFGNWDWNNNDLPFTQCFESARQDGHFRYGYSEHRDLYVAGDFYQNDVVTPAMIVVPRLRNKVGEDPDENKEVKKQNFDRNDLKEPPSPASPIMPVDQDLYRISPELLYSKYKKKRGVGFISSCLLPNCFG